MFYFAAVRSHASHVRIHQHMLSMIGSCPPEQATQASIPQETRAALSFIECIFRASGPHRVQ